ncbi:MAG TPA: PorV/PorQ family protein [Ignavibacteriales bacterium]|nr:PorV/PorQ family protein [Ignavibacteriales bacterium]
MKLYTAILISLLFYGSLLAQSKQEVVFQTEVDGIGTSAASFLEIGAGARAMAMGGAYASVANDASALYWNPAGAVWGENFQIEVMHNSWLAGTSYDFAGVVIPLPGLRSALGLSILTLGMDEQPVRTVERPEGTGEKYDARDFAIGLTYSAALTDRFSFGITGKYINQRIWNESGDAFAMDLGIFYNTQLDGLRLGFSISNFGTKLQLSGRDIDSTIDPDADSEGVDRIPAQYKTGSYSLPLLFRFGISYNADLKSFGTALLSVDLNHPSNAPESVNFGAEYGFLNMFFIRGGYENAFEDEAQNGLTLGGGIDYYMTASSIGVRLDYAWSDWGILDNAQRFSVGIVF